MALLRLGPWPPDPQTGFALWGMALPLPSCVSSPPRSRQGAGALRPVVGRQMRQVDGLSSPCSQDRWAAPLI